MTPLLGPWPLGELFRRGSVAIAEAQLQPGIPLWEQWRGFEPGQKECQPQTPDPQGGGEIQPTNCRAALVQCRHNEPIDCD